MSIHTKEEVTELKNNIDQTTSQITSYNYKNLNLIPITYNGTGSVGDGLIEASQLENDELFILKDYFGVKTNTAQYIFKTTSEAGDVTIPIIPVEPPISVDDENNYIIYGFDPSNPPPEGFCHSLADAFCGNMIKATLVAQSNVVVVEVKNSLTYIPNGPAQRESSSWITGVTWSVGIDALDNEAFARCDIMSFNIPNTVTTIGEWAFAYNAKLPSITIPNSVTEIGKGAFRGCTALKTINLSNSLTNIKEELFYGCSNLKSVEIPDSVTTIEKNAFSGCTSLTSVTISETATYIGYQAFCDCKSLTSIVIPDSVTDIGGNIFWNCDSLTSVTFGNKLEYFEVSDVSWQYNGSNITDIYFHGTIAEFSDKVLHLKYLIGDNVTVHCTDGVYEKSEPESPDVPDVPVSGGGRVLAYKTIAIEPVYWDSSRELFTTERGKVLSHTYDPVTHTGKITFDRDGVNIGRLWVAIPNMLVELYIPNCINAVYDAFTNQSHLVTVTIEKGVNTIASYAFENCSNLTNVNFEGTMYELENESNITSVNFEDTLVKVIHCTDGDYTILTIK